MDGETDSEFVAAIDEMRSPIHTVLVRPYLFGQYRIQLTRKDWPEPFGPPGHGVIVRELCTYQPSVMMETVAAIRDAVDPEALCVSLERPWNCDGPGARIRLDSTAEEDSLLKFGRETK